MTRITANKARHDVRDASMTTAEKVRHEIKAGHKPKTMEFPPLFGAMKRMCDEADRARELMGNAGLNPDDIHLALIYRLDNKFIGSSPLPAPGNIRPFITKFEQMGNVDFLGILWWQTTSEAKGKSNAVVPMWVSEFADDERSALEMLAFRNKLASMPKPE